MFAVLERLATRLYPIRSKLLVASVVGLIVIILVLRAVESSGPMLFSLLSPLVTWPWGLVVLAAWFHPTEGQVAHIDDSPGMSVMRVIPVIICFALFLSPVLFYSWSQWATAN